MALRTAIVVVCLASVLQHAGAQPNAPSASNAQSASAADQATVAAIERTLVEVIHQAEPSVVAVARSANAQQSLLAPRNDLFADLRSQPAVNQPTTVAAGVVIDPAGLILTEYLAVREGEQHTVTTVDGKTYPATIKAADPRSGLAVLAITAPASPPRRTGDAADKTQQPTPFHAIPFGDASQLRKGQFVIAIGNPYAIRSDGEPTASWGIVTNLARKAPAGANLNDTPGPNGDYRTTLHHLGTLIQTDAKLGWSAGGGALVNLHGELVGLTTTVATIAGHEQPAGYAIPIDETVRRIIDTLKQGREVEYGLLGIGFQTQENGATAAGATVQQVYPGSPAARAGLQTNDRITRVAGQAVSDVDRLQLTVSRLAPSQQIAVDYIRGSGPSTAQVTLSKLAVPGKKVITDRPPNWRGIRVDYALALDAATLAEQSSAGAIDPEGCVVVTEVAHDSPAWNAGVRPGMFISHVGDTRVTTPEEFRAAVQAGGPSVNLRLTQPIQRSNEKGGKDLEIPAPP